MAEPMLPEHFKPGLISQIHGDPGIPNTHPTVSGWQVPPHPLSEVQSETLAPVVEFAIIGSGITGCSVAKNILENSTSGGGRVTVFEARTLTSGATGRNGGQLLSHIPKFFKAFTEQHGRDETIKVAHYCCRTIERMTEMAKSECPDIQSLSEIRLVREIMAFENEEAFTEALASVQMYEDALTEEKGLYSFIPKEKLRKVFQPSVTFLWTSLAFRY